MWEAGRICVYAGKVTEASGIIRHEPVIVGIE